MIQFLVWQVGRIFSGKLVSNAGRLGYRLGQSHRIRFVFA